MNWISGFPLDWINWFWIIVININIIIRVHHWYSMGNWWSHSWSPLCPPGQVSYEMSHFSFHWESSPPPPINMPINLFSPFLGRACGDHEASSSTTAALVSLRLQIKSGRLVEGLELTLGPERHCSLLYVSVHKLQQLTLFKRVNVDVLMGKSRGGVSSPALHTRTLQVVHVNIDPWEMVMHLRVVPLNV